MAGVYFAFCYVVGLRGPEGLLADLEGLIEHFPGTKNARDYSFAWSGQGRTSLEAAPNSVRKGAGSWDTDRHLVEAVATSDTQDAPRKNKRPHFS